MAVVVVSCSISDLFEIACPGPTLLYLFLQFHFPLIQSTRSFHFGNVSCCFLFSSFHANEFDLRDASAYLLVYTVLLFFTFTTIATTTAATAAPCISFNMYERDWISRPVYACGYVICLMFHEVKFLKRDIQISPLYRRTE
ncbi:hypothetical protein T4D_11726 [Trichinella pseudospiralis]|uniref:Uncharacterized protein n=1 Tax=Trichinella pseudospiralis TaxID=6337 RepID=A0A0V1FIN0_TRIPS|nr:hypothetical protein T4D_11726 [Trichinella pseudospiralis]